jgi:hypothetical protein
MRDPEGSDQRAEDAAAAALNAGGLELGRQPQRLAFWQL